MSLIVAALPDRMRRCALDLDRPGPSSARQLKPYQHVEVDLGQYPARVSTRFFVERAVENVAVACSKSAQFPVDG
jgi:hypothetical protein